MDSNQNERLSTHHDVVTTNTSAPEVISSLRLKYQDLCMHLGKRATEAPALATSTCPSFGNILLSAMLFAELLHMGVDFKLEADKFHGRYGLTALLFAHAEVHRDFFGEDEAGTSLHDLLFSRRATGVLLRYEISFGDQAIEDSLFTWEDLCEIAWGKFEGSRFESARQSLDEMIQLGSRQLERSSYAPRREATHLGVQTSSQAWYKDCFSIRHNGRDRFEYKETAYFEELQEFDSKTETVLRYIKGLEDIQIETLDTWTQELIKRFKAQDPQFPVLSDFLISEFGLDELRLSKSPSEPSFRRLVAALIMERAISLQHEHNVKCEINVETCLAKCELAEYDEWKSVTVHFSLATAGWHHIMPLPGKAVKLILRNDGKMTEAWSFDILPPRTKHKFTARIYVPIEEDAFDFLWESKGYRDELQLRLRLPLSPKPSAIAHIESFHRLLLSRKGTLVFDIARSLRGEEDAKFSVPGIPIDHDSRSTMEVAKRLSKNLVRKQRDAFDGCLARVPYGHISVEGLTGTGKSTLAAHLALALACTQPVLVVVQSSLEAQNLESLLLKRHRQIGRDVEAFAGKLAMCRLHPAYKVRTALKNALFHEVLSDQYVDDQQLNKVLLSNEQDTNDVALHRLVKRFAQHISAHPGRYDRDQKEFAEMYLEASKACKGADGRAVPHYFRLFDQCTETLGDYLLLEMDIVLTTVECAINDLPKRYRPRCLILAEAGMMNLATGVLLAERLQPELLITFADPDHVPQALPTIRPEGNGMAAISGRRLCDVLSPGSTIILDRNMRCPPSCWEFARQTLIKARLARTDTASDVLASTQPKFRVVQQVALEGGLFNGSLANVDLYKSQQIFLNIASANKNGRGEPVSDLGTKCSSDSTLMQAVAEAIKDLLSVPGVFNQDILAQCIPRAFGQNLHDILRREAVMIRVDAPPVPGSQAPIVLTVIAECNCSQPPQQELSSDRELILALTRAQTFHFIFGCASCLSKIRARDGKPRLMQNFLEHVHGNKEVVEYRGMH